MVNKIVIGVLALFLFLSLMTNEAERIENAEKIVILENQMNEVDKTLDKVYETLNKVDKTLNEVDKTINETLRKRLYEHIKSVHYGR
jgi:septal ring factor EnvC (AmiA/AmiB activator)